jgi:replicative DNA helicase
VNIESKLLAKAVLDRDLAPLFERGVSSNWFSNETDKKIWIFVHQHFGIYGECPSLEVINSNFPSYDPKLANANDSIFFLIDALVEQRRKALIASTASEIVTGIETGDYSSAVNAMQNSLIKLELDGLSRTNDVNIIKTAQQRWENYLERKKHPAGLLGLPTGFPTIDKATLGLQPGQLCVITATPKVGKSTLAMQMAINIHRTAGMVPMFYSFEMSNKEQADRYDSMVARISQQRLLTGSLDNQEEGRLKRSYDTAARFHNGFWLVGAASGTTLSGVTNKLQIHHPDILVIDGVYLMEDEQTGEKNTPQALTNLTRGFKYVAQKYRVPIIITTQSLDKKKENGRVTANSIGYSSSFFQDADVVFALEVDDTWADKTRKLSIVASRNSGPGEVDLRWDWSNSTFRELVIEEDEL